MPKDMIHLQASRRMGRVLRLMDLKTRYLKELAEAKPVPTVVAKPAEVPVNPADQVMKVCVNGLWDFQPGNNSAQPPMQWETIRVPHGPWREVYGAFFNHGKRGTWTITSAGIARGFMCRRIGIREMSRCSSKPSFITRKYI
jgi:hypothetical protein